VGCIRNGQRTVEDDSQALFRLAPDGQNADDDAKADAFLASEDSS